jgi:hypothetical protein
MPRREPDHNAQRVLTLVQTRTPYQGDHPDEMSLFQLLTTGQSPIPEVDDAYELFTHPEDRHIVNALLLAKAPVEQISSSLSMSVPLVSAYRHLFFDRDVFRHDLDVKNYINMLAVPEEIRAYYNLACKRGFRSLANSFHIGEQVPVSPKEALQELLADQIDRARAHRGQRLDTEIARTALEWGRAAMSTANILLRTEPQDGKNALQELKLALLTQDHTTTIEELDVKPGELYH